MDLNLNDPDFLARSREVREDLDAGVPMSLGEIADRLGMAFETFAGFLAGEIFRADPSVDGVLVGEHVREVVH